MALAAAPPLLRAGLARCRAAVRREGFRGRRTYSTEPTAAACRSSKRPIALLIDGDGRSTEQIEAALASLRQRGTVDSTTLFVAPRFGQNRVWSAFIKRHGIRIEKIARGTGSAQEPNDDAINQTALSLAASPDVHCIALLVGDSGFVTLVSRIQELGKTPIVVLPNKNRPGLQQQFAETGAEVVIAMPDDKACTRVRAVLLPDGTGAIVLRPPFDDEASDLPTLQAMAMHLQSLGYHHCTDPPNLTAISPGIAKLWFTNQLGPLTVFPRTLAHNSMIEGWKSGSIRDVSPMSEKLAFVLPHSRNKADKKSLETYGTARSAAIASGGGPFILADSEDVSERFLRRLRYLDESLNTDVQEALLVFCSVARNKRNLVQLGMLAPGTTGALGSLSELRAAVLSNDTGGQWQLPPNDWKARRLLADKKMLPALDAPREEVFHALRQYLARLGLPTRKTYNGCVWQLLAHLTRDDVLRRG